MPSFFSFKDYFPFSAAKLAAFRDEHVRHRQASVSLQSQRVLNEAWTKRYPSSTQFLSEREMIAQMVWRVYSTQVGTTMIVYGTVGIMPCMFVHVVHPPSKVTSRLARYLGFFVAVEERGDVKLLSAPEWERLRADSSVVVLDGVVIDAVVAVDRVYRSAELPRMPKGYYDARYRHDIDAFLTVLHTSELFINRIISRVYGEGDAQVDTFFTFDKFPEMKTLSDSQRPPKRLCVLDFSRKIYTTLMRSTLADKKGYTPLFESYTRTFSIDGREQSIDDALTNYFSNNDMRPLLGRFMAGDPEGRMYDAIQEIYTETAEMHSSAAGHAYKPDADVYVVAAALVFIMLLESDPNAFTRITVKEWMQLLTYDSFTASVARLSLSANSASSVIFRAFLWLGGSRYNVLRTWHVSDSAVLRIPDMRKPGMPVQYKVLKAPSYSLFAADKKALKHVNVLSAHVFTLLGIRINSIGDDVHEKSVAACIEASLIMETLFANAHNVHGLLIDCLLWIAAWLLTFKLIVDRHVRSDKIDALLFMLKNYDERLSAEAKDAALFARLFHFAVDIITPECVCALLPTIRDLRRYIETQTGFAPPINFTNVYDAQIHTLHWLTSDGNVEGYTPASIKYSNDVLPSDYGTIMCGSERLLLNFVGESMQRVFNEFFGNDARSAATRAALRDLITATNSDMNVHTFTIQQLFDADRRQMFEVTRPRPSSRLRVVAAHNAAKRRLQQQIEALSTGVLMHVAWFAYSGIMKEPSKKRQVAYTANIVAGYSPAPITQNNYSEQFMEVFAEIRNPVLSDEMSIYSAQPRKSVEMRKTANAAFKYKHGVESVDIPLSFNSVVLSKAGEASRRALQGFPAIFNFSPYQHRLLTEHYNAYADFVCRYEATREKKVRDAFLADLFGLLSSKFENTFKLPPSFSGEKSLSNKELQYKRHVKSLRREDGSTRSWPLARDIANVKNGQKNVPRIPEERFYDEVSGKKNIDFSHYCNVSEVPITFQSVENLFKDESENKDTFAVTRYSPAHFFANANRIGESRHATLLLRLLTAGNHRQCDFYAPIAAYIHAGFAELPSRTPSQLYKFVGDYLSSQRGCTSVLRSSELFTGHDPIIDAYTRRAGILQMTEALQPPTGCTPVKRSSGEDIVLVRTDGEVDGVLAAEVTRIEFTVHAVGRIHVDAAENFAQGLAQKLAGEIFSTEELYPIDEYTWFQFVGAAPAPAIPEAKLKLVDIVGQLTKRQRDIDAMKSRDRSQRARVGAQIAEESRDEAYKTRRRRFNALSSRINAYRNLPGDSEDVEFSRDFSEFYVRYVLAQIENTEDVFLGSADDYAAFSRYYGTPAQEERNEQDEEVIQTFLARPENARVLISMQFPRWRVIIFGRTENSVVAVRSHHLEADDQLFSAVVEGATYVDLTVLANEAPQYAFFVMLRYLEVLFRRPAVERLMPVLSFEEAAYVEAGLLEHLKMLETALSYIFGIEMTENLDGRDKTTYEMGLRDEDRLSLVSTGAQGYLYEDVLNWFSAYLNLTYAAENPLPRRLFTIESTFLSSLLLAKQKTSLREKARPASDLHFYPWYDASRRHYYLFVVYFPTFTVVAIDSLFKRADSTIEKYARTIIEHYTSTKQVSPLQWTIVNLKKNVPMQPTDYQCGDYTMANIEFLIQWITTDKTGFENTLGLIGITGVLYSEEQERAVSELAANFRTRTLALANALNTTAASSSSVSAVDDEDGSIVILSSDDEQEEEESTNEERIDNPSIEYNAEEEVSTLGTHVYPACTVRGYEISAQRYGNSMRYVRYGDSPNVEFTRLPRTAINYAEEASLSYWRMRELQQTSAGEELVARMPGGDAWRRLLLTGFPYEVQPRTGLKHSNASSNVVGPTLGVGARIVPLIEKRQDLEKLAASPLPVYRPRTVINSILG